MIKKKASNIVARQFEPYNPATFEKFAMPNFQEVSAEELLERISPATFDFLPGRRFISTDTETFYTGVPAERLPKEVVRRWIKQKQKYIPNDFPFCIPICDGKNAFVVYDTLQNQFKEFKKLEKLLADPTIDKIYHNSTYDQHMKANAKVNVRGRIHDTAILSRLVRADAFSHRLIDVVKDMPGSISIFEHMLDAYKATMRITDYRYIPHDLMTQYTCADTWNTMIAFQNLYPLVEELDIKELYELESAISARVAYSMERIGIKINTEYKDTLIPELEKEVNEAERAIYETAGYQFNINSAQQLYEALKKLGYGDAVRFNEPTAAMLEKGILQGNPCFDKNELERLENEGVPLITHIQQYRRADKLLNTFAKKIFEMPDFEGHIHCNFNTVEARTGRFSVSQPSMQNMPRRKDDRVRGAFMAPEGFTLYDMDFKSQEAIVLAHYSRAPFLIEMINAGHDIHVATASLVFGVDIDEFISVMNSKPTTDEEKAKQHKFSEMRGDAKAVGFAIVYGAGAQKIASMTYKSLEDARMIMRKYLNNIPEVDMFIKTCNKVARERGVVKTRLGRRVYTQKNREYACVNYVIQGSSADSTKSRMLDIYKFLKANGYKSRMLLQVHDSLLYMIADDEAGELLGKIKWLQTERDLFRVTVPVDIDKCSPTWRDKKKANIEAIKPSDEELERMRNYDVWSEGVFDI